jgi:hypothetical protein
MFFDYSCFYSNLVIKKWKFHKDTYKQARKANKTPEPTVSDTTERIVSLQLKLQEFKTSENCPKNIDRKAPEVHEQHTQNKCMV